jgi:hypothetical protein
MGKTCDKSKVAGDKGISEIKSKQQNPFSICIHQAFDIMG